MKNKFVTVLITFVKLFDTISLIYLMIAAIISILSYTMIPSAVAIKYAINCFIMNITAILIRCAYVALRNLIDKILYNNGYCIYCGAKYITNYIKASFPSCDKIEISYSCPRCSNGGTIKTDNVSAIYK